MGKAYDLSMLKMLCTFRASVVQFFLDYLFEHLQYFPNSRAAITESNSCEVYMNFLIYGS